MKTKIRLKPYIPFLFLFALMLTAHISITYSKDDTMFRAALDHTDAGTYLRERWENWSSRIIIEGTIIRILDIDRFPLWKTLNCLLFLPLAWAVCRLTKKEAGPHISERYGWFTVGLILLYPYGYDMSTAGWAATTMNYFWPLVFGLLALIPIRKQLDHEPLKWYHYVTVIPLFLYAANAEQTCMLLLIIYGVFFIWQLAVNKTFCPFFLFMVLLGLFSLWIILSAPGNSIRVQAELTRFTDYPMLTFWDKLDLALASTLSQLICRSNLPFLFFSLMLAAAVWKKYSDLFFRLIASFPAACSLLFGIFEKQTAVIYPDLPMLVQTSEQGIITPDNYFLFKSYLPLMVMGGVIICVLISFYLIYCDERQSDALHSHAHSRGLLSVFVFLLGLSSRAMMAFSPTVWASNTRTNIYLDFSVIFLCCLLYVQTEEEQRSGSFLQWLLGILAIFSFGMQFAVM